MSVECLIARMRSRQAELFTTGGALTRIATAGTVDDETAARSAPTTETIYDGSALVRPSSEAERAGIAGSVETVAYTVRLPADTDVAIGDVFTVTASAHDTGLVGASLRVIHCPPDEWQVCRKAVAVIET